MRRVNVFVAILLTAIGATFLFTYHFLDDVARGTGTPFAEPLIEEFTAAFSLLALLPLVVRLARRCRLDGPGWPRAAAVHVPAALLFGAVDTSLMWASRSLIFPLFGLGAYNYGRMPVRYFMELPMQLIAYGTILIVVYLIDHVRAVRERDLRMAQLETQLVRARLDALRAQIQPHFLFNALNAVSSVMYEDPAAADTILARLSELLRRSMRSDAEPFVPLAEELETVDLYFDVLRARFGDGVHLTIEHSGERDARVPPLVLQPLVENAVRHGRPANGTAQRITVRARVAGSHTELEVEDNGPGMSEDWRTHAGIGLTNTIERLQRLYGDDFDLDIQRAPDGGANVRLRLPRTADPG